MITFEAGVPIAIDGEKVSMLQAIQPLNERAGAQGVGRLDMVEDRLVGIKSREVYEAPGAIALITAHMELENVTVERELARFKRGVDQRWGELVYDGQWFSPLKRALDTFIDEAQRSVTGEIRMTLHAGKATVTGRRSDVSLYDFNLATYDEGDTFDQAQARGFIEIYGMSSKLAARRDATLPDGADGDEHRQTLGRPVRRRAGRGDVRAESVDPVRLAAGPLRPGRIAGPRAGPAPGRTADRGRAGGHDRRAGPA